MFLDSFLPSRFPVPSLVLLLALLALPAVAGCPKPSATTDGGVAGDAGSANTTTSTTSGVTPFDALAVARAEDLRHAKDLPPDVRGSHDVVARRESARALSRIADTASVEGLTAHLADEDADVVTWAAYGLGHACKTREDATVKMLDNAA